MSVLTWLNIYLIILRFQVLQNLKQKKQKENIVVRIEIVFTKEYKEWKNYLLG